MKTRFAIFDLDHTLIRSTNMHLSWQAALEQEGLADRYEESWVGAAGRPLEQSAAIALGSDVDDPRVHQLVASFWEKIGDGDPEEIEGASEILETLAGRGIRLFLSTASHPAPVAKWLAARGWEKHFELVLASTPDHPKGAAHYLTIVEYLGMPIEEFAPQAVTIGDGHYDMRYGHDHGVALRVGYAPLVEGHEDKSITLRSAGANAIVRHLDDVADVIAHRERVAEPDEVLVERAKHPEDSDTGVPRRRRQKSADPFAG